MTAPDQPALNDCGCCDGLTVETPVEADNRPGLAAIAYRVGTHSQFKASMLALLHSTPNFLALGNLKTREYDDFTIALLDAWATVSDVLTFYQERIANESYLRTATERGSIINLAQLIGYELRPGVAASAYLAFTLESGPGSPASVTLDKGLKVQSLPGPGQKPQTFETIEQIEARPDWNALKPRLTGLRYPVFGDTWMFLAGVTTNLKPGDSLLIVGAERLADPQNENWEIRRVSSVEPDATNNRTLVTWDKGLGSATPHVDPPKQDPKVYALRLHASLFGFNAPDWHTLPVALRVGEINPHPKADGSDVFLPGAYAGRKDPTKNVDTWAEARFAAGTKSINLDAVYNQVILNSWIVLVKPAGVESPDTTSGTKPGATPADASLSSVKLASAASAGVTPPDDTPACAALYRVQSAGQEAKADFNISAKTTRLGISGENIDKFSPRTTTVLAQSEELELAETPLDTPVQGLEITLDRVVEGLAGGRTLIVTGKRMRASIGAALTLTSADGSQTVPLNPGDSLIVMGPTVNVARRFVDIAFRTAGRSIVGGGAPQKRWHLMHKTGLDGYVTAPQNEIAFAPAAAEDAVVNEVVQLDEAVLSDDEDHTILKLNFTTSLTKSLTNIYDAATVAISANAALSTHGETIKDEVLGSGDAGQPYQSFALHQSPLTYTSADTSSGGESTLEVRIDGLKWTEVPSLFGHGPRERIYLTHTDNDARTTVQFGDGQTGARLPMGRENVKATYRKGIGLEGLVDARQLSLPMTRPLGLKSVLNPLPTAGAQDPQSLADARTNAPLTVLTLDRIVSLRDYEDFARSFSGIAKAQATWTWTGHARQVFVTVAGINGAPVADRSDLLKSLVSAMLKAGDSYVGIRIKSYQRVTFTLAANVKVDEQYVQATVLAAVEAALRSSFSFDARAFGQPVALSEVIAVMQNVPGVVAVEINEPFRGKDGTLQPLLQSNAPQVGDGPNVQAAELLTLDPEPLALGVMP